MTRQLAPLAVRMSVALTMALTSWVVLLSWRSLTEGYSEVAFPLLFMALALAVGGAVGRWAGAPAALVLFGQAVLSGLVVLGTVTGSPLPTSGALSQFSSAWTEAVASSRAFAAPVPASEPPIYPLLLVGGAMVLMLADVVACTLRRVPVAGLVLLAAYSMPVTLSGRGVSWWIFTVAAAGYLLAVFLQHAEQLSRWGRAMAGTTEEQADPAGFGVHTGAIRGTATAIGATATLVALAAPAAIPTMSVSFFDGAGPGNREIEVIDPMVDLRRDLVRDEDVPLLYVRSRGNAPSYLRMTVLTRFGGNTWTPGDRDIPETQGAEGEMPRPDGVGPDVGRATRAYSVQTTTAFDSTWLPITPQVTTVQAGPQWRYDRSTMDFIAAADDVTAAGISYTFTGLDLTYDADRLDSAPSGATQVRSLYTEVPASLNPRVRALTASITDDQPTRYRKAAALQQWFRDNFEYTLDTVEDDGTDNLVTFLTEDQRGYCEQFAASMAIMARTLGIPARVAVGFLDSRAVGPGTFEFSSHDLHAWPELYFPGSGWVRFEPTPSDRAEGVPPYTRVDGLPRVQPTPTAPSTSASDLLPERNQEPSAGPEADPGDAQSATPWGRVVGAAGTLLAALALSLLPRTIRSRRREQRLVGGVEEVWLELRDACLDLGHPWPPGRSPREAGAWLARRLGDPGAGRERAERPRTGRDHSPAAADALDRLVDRLERSRYAREGIDVDSRELRHDAEQVLDALVAGVPPRNERRARWWPASVVRHELPRPRRRPARSAPMSPTSRTSGVVDHVGG